LTELEAQIGAPDFWGDANTARDTMREKARLEADYGLQTGLRAQLDDALALLELGQEAGDAGSVAEAEALLKALSTHAARLETQCLLRGPADFNAAYLEIHAGAGGTESCDWAGMLLRMYSRWAERQGFKVVLVDEQDGDQAGIKSATLQIQGPYAYGLAKMESGVHRLVRISPFDSNARRHTSFASVFVYPEIDETIVVEINPADVRVDTYRSSGAGGQHVNTTDSAIRITHIPTNTVVTCQQDRSQHRNREIAWNLLRAKLFELEQKKQQAARDSMAANQTEIGWGHQIRSYVLQPYQMIKDLRTGVETSNTVGVLDGDLNAFIQAALADKVGSTR
jgi:peptide chain release factor 2